MKKLFYISAVALMAFASCNKANQEIIKPETPSADEKVTLTVAANVPVKTVMNEGKVSWAAGDVITVLAEGTSVKSSASAGSVASETFTVTDWPASVTPQYAVYTGLGDQTYDAPELNEDGSISMTVKSSQTIASAGSFSETANVSVGALVAGQDGTYSTTLMNVCGLLQFSLKNAATSVVIESLGDNPAALAGDVKVAMTDGKPEVKEVVTPATTVTVLPAGDAFEAGKTYYVCVLPGTYSLKITTTPVEGEPVVLTGKSTLTVNRAEWMEIGQIDNISGDEPAEPIVLTLDFDTDTNPFAETMPLFYPSDASHTDYTRRPSAENGDVYTHNGYEFVIVNTKTIYAWSPKNYLRLNHNSADGDFMMQFPAIEGMKLTQVVVRCGNKGTFRIYNPRKEELAYKVIETGKEFTFTIASPVASASYYLGSVTKNISIAGLVLTYTE